MKKFVLIVLCTLFLFGCKKDYQKELEEVGKTYYETYVKGKVTGLDKVEITLNDLKKLDKIDLSKVKSCSNDTKITMVIKDNNISNYIIVQDCK